MCFICVKIAQHPLPQTYRPFVFFPFDRLYLSKKQDEHLFEKMFRYYFKMRFSSSLLHVITNLQYAKICKYPRKERPHDFRHHLFDRELSGRIKEFQDELMIIPTHVQTAYKNYEKKDTIIGSKIAYFMSRAVGTGLHPDIKLPKITLHTPKKEIPLICAICSKSPSYHANECSPGTKKCCMEQQLVLPRDKSIDKAVQQALEDTGGETWT